MLVFPFWPDGFRIPEDFPVHSALQAVFNVLKLYALNEIRRKNLGLTDDSPK